MVESNNIKELLEQELEARELTIEELVRKSGELLKLVAPHQTRYKVTERPDVRTIRYYISQKLLPRPESYEGGKARFTGRHLLRLLVIKKLQAEHQTLRQIAGVLKQSDVRLQHLLIGNDQPPVQTAEHAPQIQQERPELGGSTIRRIPLYGGAHLDLPRTAEKDPNARRELASQLEQLARILRTRGDER